MMLIVHLNRLTELKSTNVITLSQKERCPNRAALEIVGYLMPFMSSNNSVKALSEIFFIKDVVL